MTVAAVFPACLGVAAKGRDTSVLVCRTLLSAGRQSQASHFPITDVDVGEYLLSVNGIYSHANGWLCIIC